MKHHEESFQGPGELRIYHQSWQSEDVMPKAVIIIAHGLAEHSGRYMNVVNFFVPHGYAIYALDHPGHGKSAGKRVYVERFDDFIRTLDMYIDMVKQQNPTLPLFLLGHSMGGLISAVYLLDHQQKLTGAILSGPALKTSGTVSPLIGFVGKLLSVLAPGSGLFQLEAEGISRDPAVVQAYKDDPLVTYPGKLTARLAAELLAGMQRAMGNAKKVTLPIMLAQGSADRLVDPAGARQFYDTVSSDDKTLQVYNGLFHEVFNEPEKEQVLHDVEVWLNIHVSL